MSYIKIYFDSKPVYLCDEITPEITTLKDQEDTIYMYGLSNKYIQSMPRQIQEPQYNQGIIYHENFDDLKEAFFAQFKIRIAGGGLIMNEKDEILMIFRRGKWDLPKGKLDKGETIEECSVREVKEETGLKNVILGEKIGTTYHTYSERGVLMVKESVWFAMKASENEVLIPQTQEDILEVKWVDKEGLEECKKNSFATITEMLSLFEGK
ncbi:MAG: NUDIX domain-containing protein [Ginsengibacter sp.]